MSNASIPILNILDILQFTRKNTKIHTTDKACPVISCRIRGESTFFYDHTTHLVKRGDILFVPREANYSHECLEEELITFHLEAFSHLGDRILLSHPHDPDKICTLFQKAADLWRTKDPLFECRCMSLLYQILAEGNLQLNATDRKLPAPLSRAIQYLETHITDSDLTVTELCRNSHISRTHFNKLFENAYGCTPVTYINQQRIHKAIHLLQSGLYTNEEISQLCGFKDVKYFYVIFKKVTGMTTRKFLQ